MQERSKRVLDLAQTRGFALAGIAKAQASPRGEVVRKWVADGKHGTMGWLENNLDIRIDPHGLLDGARSVIAVCDAYATQGTPQAETRGTSQRLGKPDAPLLSPPSSARPPRELDAPPLSPRGKVARYAWGDDYHKVLKKRLHALAAELADLFPGARFRTTVDTAPALEREIAAYAGLGWQAKNTMLIHPRHGSYTLLGLIVTTLELPTTHELRQEDSTLPRKPSPRKRSEKLPGLPEKLPGELPGPNPSTSTKSSVLPGRLPGELPGGVDHCANCTKCIDACPTDAIASEGYSIDASRCVSYLTLEHRQVISPEFHAGIGDWIAGCDICQEVCPYNQIGQRNPLPIHERYDPAPRGFDRGLDLLELVSWTAEDRARVLQGSALKRIKLDMIRRNALIALGNVLAEREDPALRDAVTGCAQDESEMVRQTAEQVLARLGPASA